MKSNKLILATNTTRMHKRNPSLSRQTEMGENYRTLSTLWCRPRSWSSLIRHSVHVTTRHTHFLCATSQPRGHVYTGADVCVCVCVCLCVGGGGECDCVSMCVGWQCLYVEFGWLLGFHILATSTVISGRVSTCDSACSWWLHCVSPPGDQVTSTLTLYPTQSYYHNTEPTSSCPNLLMPTSG